MATAATGAGKKGFAAWYAGHKNEALLGGAGIVVAIALYVKSKNAASSTSSGATPSTSTVMPGTTAPSTYGGGGGDMSGIDELLQQLQTEVSALQPSAGSSGSGAPTIPSGEVLAGSGYSPGNAGPGGITAGGHTYLGLSSPSQLLGEPTFIQVAPGDFIPTPSSGVAPGTTQYVQT